jgi:hypothetical protein
MTRCNPEDRGYGVRYAAGYIIVHPDPLPWHPLGKHRGNTRTREAPYLYLLLLHLVFPHYAHVQVESGFSKLEA